jgi:AcrR family transcriptional regulator
LRWRKTTPIRSASCSGGWHEYSVKKSKAETAETRRRIVEIASKAFRSKGIAATGVAEIMAAAGLTHGGFYRHFSSKEELVADAVAMSLEQLVLDSEKAAEEGAEAALNHALEYLSPASRMVDDPLLSDRILEVTRERLTVSVMGDYPKVGLKRTLLQRRNTLKDRICLALRFREGGFFLHTPSENSGILEGLVRRQNRLVDADR